MRSSREDKDAYLLFSSGSPQILTASLHDPSPLLTLTTLNGGTAVPWNPYGGKRAQTVQR